MLATTSSPRLPFWSTRHTTANDGIPEEDEAKAFTWTTVMLGVGDDEGPSGEFDDVVAVVTEMADYAVPARRGVAERLPVTTSPPAWCRPKATRRAPRHLLRSPRSSYCCRPQATRRRAAPISHGMVALTRYPRKGTSGGPISMVWPPPPSRRWSDGLPRHLLLGCGAT